MSYTKFNDMYRNILLNQFWIVIGVYDTVLGRLENPMTTVIIWTIERKHIIFKSVYVYLMWWVTHITFCTKCTVNDIQCLVCSRVSNIHDLFGILWCGVLYTLLYIFDIVVAIETVIFHCIWMWLWLWLWLFRRYHEVLHYTLNVSSYHFCKHIYCSIAIPLSQYPPFYFFPKLFLKISFWTFIFVHFSKFLRLL